MNFDKPIHLRWHRREYRNRKCVHFEWLTSLKLSVFQHTFRYGSVDSNDRNVDNTWSTFNQIISIASKYSDVRFFEYIKKLLCFFPKSNLCRKEKSDTWNDTNLFFPLLGIFSLNKCSITHDKIFFEKKFDAHVCLWEFKTDKSVEFEENTGFYGRFVQSDNKNSDISSEEISWKEIDKKWW